MLDPETTLVAEHEIDDLSFAQDLRLLAEEARTLAQAELAFQKTRAAYVAAEARTIALLAVVAVVVVFFALMALVFGLVLSLASVIGPWGSTAVVTLALVLGAVALGLSAKARMGRMRAVLKDDGPAAGIAGDQG